LRNERLVGTERLLDFHEKVPNLNRTASTRFGLDFAEFREKLNPVFCAPVLCCSETMNYFTSFKHVAIQSMASTRCVNIDKLKFIYIFSSSFQKRMFIQRSPKGLKSRAYVKINKILI